MKSRDWSVEKSLRGEGVKMTKKIFKDKSKYTRKEKFKRDYKKDSYPRVIAA